MWSLASFAVKLSPIPGWALALPHPHRLALLLHYARDELESPPGEFHERLDVVAAEIGATQAGVAAAQHEPRDLRLLHGPEAHRARLDRRVERRAGEIQRLQAAAGIAHRRDFRVRARVEVAEHRVLALAQDLPVARDDGRYWPVPRPPRGTRGLERHGHVAFMLVHARPRFPVPIPYSIGNDACARASYPAMEVHRGRLLDH